MNGGSSAPYLARTPCVPLFSTLFSRYGNRRAFRLPGAGGGSFPLYGGTFARSYSVSIIVENMSLIATVPRTDSIVGGRVNLVRDGQHVGPDSPN